MLRNLGVPAVVMLVVAGVAAAVAGALTVVLLVRMTRRMTGSTTLGCLAGLLLTLDGLHFVQSRIAMLDVFLVLWTTAAAACSRGWGRRPRTASTRCSPRRSPTRGSRSPR